MTNVVFIHGLWISHTAWQRWIEHFAAQGHHAIAPAWPGESATAEQTRRGDRHRPSPHQGCQAAAHRAAALGIPRPGQPVQPRTCQGPDPSAVALRVRQCPDPGGVRRTLGAVGDPVTG